MVGIKGQIDLFGIVSCGENESQGKLCWICEGLVGYGDDSGDDEDYWIVDFIWEWERQCVFIV